MKEYLNSWDNFRVMCEAKVKDVCVLSRKNWKKLREFHMEQFLKSQKSSFSFMFKMKWKYPEIYRTIHCAPYYYHRARIDRQHKFPQSVGSKYVTFPTWLGFYGDKNETR